MQETSCLLCLIVLWLVRVMVMFVFPSDFTVRDSSPQPGIPAPVSLHVMTPKERKDGVTQSYSLSGSLPNCDRSVMY